MTRWAVPHVMLGDGHTCGIVSSSLCQPMQRAGERRDATRQDHPSAGTTRYVSKHTVTRSTPSVGEPSSHLDAGAPAGQPSVLEQALTGLVQNGHAWLLVIQSARIDVLDA
jgi:hypothetical protein